MKKTIKLVSLVLVVGILAVLCSSCGSFGANEKIEYEEVEGGYALFRYSGVSTIDSLTIPDEYEGKPVVEIMKYAISSADYIKTLTIGKNVTKISEWAISNCLALERIVLSEENPSYSLDEQGILYNKDKTELFFCPNGAIKDGRVVVPSTVTKIAETAFYLSDRLTEITFNEGLTEIGGYAFLKCEKLQSLTFPSTLTKIGPDGFSYCDGLTDLYIPKNVTEIGDFAFFSLASKISVIKFERTQEEMSGVSLGKSWIPNQSGSLRQPVPVEYGII